MTLVVVLLMERVFAKLKLLILARLRLNTLITGKHEDTPNVLQDDFDVVYCLKAEIDFEHLVCLLQAFIHSSFSL